MVAPLPGLVGSEMCAPDSATIMPDRGGIAVGDKIAGHTLRRLAGFVRKRHRESVSMNGFGPVSRSAA